MLNKSPRYVSRTFEKKHFEEQLEKIKKERNLGKMELATLFGVSHNTIKNGLQSGMLSKRVVRIMQDFGVTFVYTDL